MSGYPWIPEGRDGAPVELGERDVRALAEIKQSLDWHYLGWEVETSRCLVPEAPAPEAGPDGGARG